MRTGGAAGADNLNNSLTSRIDTTTIAGTRESRGKGGGGSVASSNSKQSPKSNDIHRHVQIIDRIPHGVPQW